MSAANAHQRWYDQDPALSRAMESLAKASDGYQAQVALNIIKVIVEHRIELESGESLEHDRQVQQLIEEARSAADRTQSRRWYDVNETLRSALQLLHDTPSELQLSVIPSVAAMIEQTLSKEL